MKNKFNNFFVYFFKFAIFFGVFFVLFNSGINFLIFPFSISMLYALVWANQKVWIVSPAYILSGALYKPTMEFAICLLLSVFCLVVPYFVHVLVRKNIRKWELFIYASLGQIANIVFDVIGGLHPALSLVSVIFSLLFMFACIGVFEALLIRGFSNKLTNLEIVSLFAIIAVVCGGLSVLNIGKFNFLKLFASFVVLLFAFCSTPTLTLLVSSVAGLGALIATSNPIYFAPFLIWAMCAMFFKNRLRIFMILAVLASELLIGLYFKLYMSFGVVEMLPILISCAIFLLLPKQWCNEISVVFNLSKDRIAMKNVANRNREILHKRLGNLGEVFNDMNIIYRNMLKRGMSLEEVKTLLNQEISSKICSFCPERNHCHRTFEQNTRKVFDELITISFEKGRATLLDIPSYLTSRCKQTNSILGSINTLTSQYKKYMEMIKEVDTSKLVIADQLLGVSKIMSGLAKDVETSISFDTVRENKILDELTYHNIICIDAVVFEKDVWTIEVSLVVKNEDSAKPRIVDVASKICGKKMAIYEIFPSNRPGYTVINLRTAPKFDCVFGVCQKVKNGSKASGDTYSIIKLDGNRIMFAINDGMGSGEKAQDASELSISLVENFYKAGFENEIVLSTTNKLLNLYKEEIFSALDICIFDEKDGIVDFIKMASPNSFIANESECKIVEAGALPIGIVEESKPSYSKNVVDAKDMIVLCSDGVSDSFESTELLKEVIKSIKTKNPQEFADELMERAISNNNGYAVDDMTIIAIKVLNF